MDKMSIGKLLQKRYYIVILLIAIIFSLIVPSHITVASEAAVSSADIETGVSADISDWLQEYEYREPFTTEIEPNKYEINYGGEIVQVGKGTTVFSPDVTLYRWDKECYLTIGKPVINNTVISQKTPNATLATNAIGWDSNGLGFKFYPKTQTEQNEYGSFEYEITLADSKAGTGELLREITFPINSSSLEFYYQPELTQKEIDDGAYRPDNVVGSYAVYHSSKKNYVIGQVNYGTGKAFHIYRPMLIDSKGGTVYADLIITENSLTIDFSKISEWLEKANYPVTIDPEFGYTGAGGSSDTYYSNYCVGIWAETPADAATGTDWKMYQSVKMHEKGATGNCKGYIGGWDEGYYLVDNGVGGVSTQITSTKGWAHSDYSTAPSVENTSWYAIAVVVGNASSGCFDLYYDTTGDGWYENISGGYANPGVLYDPNDRDRSHSVYASYTSGGGEPEASNAPSSKAFGIINVGGNSNTAINYFTVSNIGTGSVDVEIQGTDFTGGDDTWTLSDNATVGVNIFGFKVGLDDGDDLFDIIVKKSSSTAFIDNLLVSGNQSWGLQILMPSSVTNYDNQSMTSTITLIVSAH